jgi:hypothetical protein
MLMVLIFQSKDTDWQRQTGLELKDGKKIYQEYRPPKKKKKQAGLTILIFDKAI